MRALPLLTALALLAAPAAAQENRPLYNAQGSGGTTLYNSGASGAQPLSLKQITQGKNTTGYSYERNTSGYRPYSDMSTASLPSQEQVDAFRARRSAQAQTAEQQALSGLANGHQNNAAAPVFPGAGLHPATGINPYGMPAGPKKQQRYDGRDTGVTIPPKVFNSVR